MCKCESCFIVTLPTANIHQISYLNFFKADGPVIHFMFTEMKNLLTTLMRQFLESIVVNGKIVKDLMDADVRDPSNQLQLFNCVLDWKFKFRL